MIKKTILFTVLALVIGVTPMVLGVETQWAAQFADVYRQNPSWYNDGHSSSFNAYLLTASLQGCATKVNSALHSSVRSSMAVSGASGFGGDLAAEAAEVGS